MAAVVMGAYQALPGSAATTSLARLSFLDTTTCTSAAHTPESYLSHCDGLTSEPSKRHNRHRRAAFDMRFQAWKAKRAAARATALLLSTSVDPLSTIGSTLMQPIPSQPPPSTKSDFLP